MWRRSHRSCQGTEPKGRPVRLNHVAHHEHLSPRTQALVTGIGPICSELPINAPAEIVYAFLAHLPNHERLSDRRLQLVSLASDRLGGRITIRGPLGIRRTAETTVTDLRPHVVVGGTATVGRRTAA